MNILKNTCYSYLNTQTCDAEFNVLRQLAVGYAAYPLSVIIHEAGHAAAAYLLHKNPKPKIVLHSYGYREGECSYNSQFLSKVGRWLGRSNTRAIIAAAGPLVEMTASLALLRFFPGNGISALSLMSNAKYAISALSQKAFFSMKEEGLSSDHDFVTVKIHKGGLAAATLMITSVALGIFGVSSLLMETLAVEGVRI